MNNDMKKIFIMLFVALAAVTTASAQKPKANANVPTNVISRFDYIVNMYGQTDKQRYSVIKNPNTNQIESSEKITHFVGGDDADADFIRMAFTADEPLCYQILHLVPGDRDFFSIKVVNNEPGQKTLNLRTNMNQEMWYMAVKNPENPQLRDVYAITWEKNKNGELEGDVYMVTSLRPDIYQQNLEQSSKTFKIEGRIDGEIKDSLYNVYIADSYEELNALGDDDYVACVPVVNKRFEYSVELDKPKAGRIRCIFPDGSLCSAWINLDMVPGETYRITVHNGYFDEDRDYERRVGRYSGKSLIAGHDNDDNSSPVVLDEKGNVVEYSPAVQTSNPLANLTEEQKAAIDAKGEAIDARMQLVKKIYKDAITKQVNSTNAVYQNGKRKEVSDMDTFFEQIMKQNEQIDKQFGDLLNTANSYGMEKQHIAKLIGRGMLEFLSEQNKAFIDLYGHFGSLSKVGTKCQKQVDKLTEKYLNEMSKVM